MLSLKHEQFITFNLLEAWYKNLVENFPSIRKLFLMELPSAQCLFTMAAEISTLKNIAFVLVVACFFCAVMVKLSLTLSLL